MTLSKRLARARVHLRRLRPHLGSSTYYTRRNFAPAREVAEATYEITAARRTRLTKTTARAGAALTAGSVVAAPLSIAVAVAAAVRNWFKGSKTVKAKTREMIPILAEQANRVSGFKQYLASHRHVYFGFRGRVFFTDSTRFFGLGRYRLKTADILAEAARLEKGGK